MKWFIKSVVVSFVMLSLISCAETEEQSNPIPEPVPPVEHAGEIYNPPPTPEPDTRLPDLTKAVPLFLNDPIFYSGLEDLAQTLFLPLVGDPFVSMQISGGREQLVTGSALVSFEDNEGFWGAELNSFEETGIRTSDVIDMIFADDELVIRTIGALNSDDFDGIVYYRLREDGDNECKRIITTCEIQSPFPMQFVPPGFQWEPPECEVNVDVNTPCRAYMNTNNDEVKELGTFKAKYSNWVVR